MDLIGEGTIEIYTIPGEIKFILKNGEKIILDHHSDVEYFNDGTIKTFVQIYIDNLLFKARKRAEKK